MVLGLAEIPGFPSTKDLVAARLTLGASIIFSIAILFANAWFLFRHARGDYLTVRNGLRPMAMSLLVLSIAFPLAYAATRVAFRGGALPDLGALVRGEGLEWARIARSVFVGQGALTLVLLYSGLWRSPSQETVELCSAWDRSKPLLRRVFRIKDDPLDKAEHERLIALLMVLKEGAKKLDTKALVAADLEVAGRLGKSADAVLKLVNTATGLLPNRVGEPSPAVDFLLGETSR
jgi:hypothetical protein